MLRDCDSVTGGVKNSTVVWVYRDMMQILYVQDSLDKNGQDFFEFLELNGII